MVETFTLEVPYAGDTVRVVIRKKRGWAAANEVEGSKLVLDTDGKIAGINLAKFGLATMSTAIMSWSLEETARDDNGAFNTEYVMSDDFDPDLGDAIVAAIGGYYRDRLATTAGKSSAAEPSIQP